MKIKFLLLFSCINFFCFAQKADSLSKTCWYGNEDLDSVIYVDHDGSNATLLFFAGFCNMTTERTKLQIVREKYKGKNDTAFYSYDKKWTLTYSLGKDQDWANFDPPFSEKTCKPAMGQYMGPYDEGCISFLGQVSVNNQIKKIIILGEILADEDDEVVDQRTTEVDVKELDFKDSIAPNSNFIVYPNPTNGQFVAQGIIKDTTDLTVSLTNMNGEIIATFDKEMNFTGTYHRMIDISSLPAGMYFLVLRMNDDKKVLKVIKK